MYKNVKSKIFKIMIVIAITMIAGLCDVKAYNYETSELRVYSFQNNFRICVQSNILKESNTFKIHLWDSFHGNRPYREWPGVDMTKEEGTDDIYCYTHTDDGYLYDYVLFHNNSGKQTIDLSTINDTKGLINTFLYNFEESDREYSGKYRGRWYVYDTQAIKDLVTEAKSLNKNDYTISTYNAVKAALGDSVEVSQVTEQNQGDYQLEADYYSKLTRENDILDKLVVTYEGGQYYATYLDKYNALATAMNNLKKRKDIVVNNNISNGSVSASYKQDSDRTIKITPTPATGYKLESITVKKITSYDADNKPVFGESTSIDISSGNYEYSFAASEYDSDNMVGVYVDATFKKKVYTLTFTVGANGEIKNLDGTNVENPIHVEYNDGYTIRIKANTGYKIDKVTVNGTEKTISDDVLELKNIKQNTTVSITFKLKKFTVKIDDKNYTFLYGTTYDEILEDLVLEKEGYKFLYLTDKNGNKISSEYVVTKDDELKTLYEELASGQAMGGEEVSNPHTGDSIFDHLFIILLSATGLLTGIDYLRKRKRKSNA